MKRLATLTLVLLTASCGANYSPNSDLAPDPSQPQAAINTNQVCRACTHDADCGPNAFCATEDATGDQFCTTPCYSDGTCDTGLTCFTIDDNGNTGCYPSSGTCAGIIATSGGTGSGGDSGNSSAGATSAGATSAGATSSGTTSAGATSSGTTTSAGATSSSTTTTSSGTTTGGITTAGATSSGTTTAGATTTGSGSTTSSGSTTGTTGACTTDTWTSTMKSFFTSKCSSCHSVSKSFADSGQGRIDSGSMPPGGGLSQSDRQRVDTWIGCGSP
ncbi:MAG: hypothetical protein JST54_21260 [Deltaproteobacteria bacterium]|nr:hypothetical protein [Deltaproteobacteria bacterium]